MMVTLGEIHPFPTATADEEQAAKILEEAAEVFCAWQQFDAKGRAYYRKPFLHSLLCECADLIMACGNMAAGLGMTLSTEVEPHYRELDKSCVRELLVRAAEVQRRSTGTSTKTPCSLCTSVEAERASVWMRNAALPRMPRTACLLGARK